MTNLLFYSALACIGSGLFLITFTLGKHPPLERPVYGVRGVKRKLALEAGGLFRWFEPSIRLVGGWVANAPFHSIREKATTMSQRSGEWLGLDGDEAIGMGIVCAVAGALVGAGAVHQLDLPAIVMFVFFIFGLLVPYLQMSNEVTLRFKNINRALPSAIDLAALCMGAGLDFPGSLRQIAEKSSESSADLVEEVKRILQELELGHTRAQALTNFGERCPTESVQDFVATVVQAEAKGTPLAEVLSIQAKMLRMRRSIAAEEAAAKAGLQLMMPMMLVFLIIIILIAAPFAINLSNSGL